MIAALSFGQLAFTILALLVVAWYVLIRYFEVKR